MSFVYLVREPVICNQSEARIFSQSTKGKNCWKVWNPPQVQRAICGSRPNCRISASSCDTQRRRKAQSSAQVPLSPNSQKSCSLQQILCKIGIKASHFEGLRQHHQYPWILLHLRVDAPQLQVQEQNLTKSKKKS